MNHLSMVIPLTAPYLLSNRSVPRQYSVDGRITCGIWKITKAGGVWRRWTSSVGDVFDSSCGCLNLVAPISNDVLVPRYGQDPTRFVSLLRILASLLLSKYRDWK